MRRIKSAEAENIPGACSIDQFVTLYACSSFEREVVYTSSPSFSMCMTLFAKCIRLGFERRRRALSVFLFRHRDELTSRALALNVAACFRRSFQRLS